MGCFAPISSRAWKTLTTLVTNLSAKIAWETPGIYARTICFTSAHVAKDNAPPLHCAPLSSESGKTRKLSWTERFIGINGEEKDAMFTRRSYSMTRLESLTRSLLMKIATPPSYSLTKKTFLKLPRYLKTPLFGGTYCATVILSKRLTSKTLFKMLPLKISSAVASTYMITFRCISISLKLRS
jgi:hypothetical protein